MATLSADKANLGRQVHVGANVVKSKLTTTASLSAGDVIRFCRLPNQATVTGVVFYGDYTSTATVTVKVGTDSSTARFYVSSSALTTLHTATLIGTSEATRGIGYKFSASDDASNQYEYVTATVLSAATASPGDSITAIITYILSN